MNVAKRSKAGPTNDRSRESRRHDGRSADRRRRSSDFGREDYRCRKVPRRYKAAFDSGGYRSWRASTAARPYQRALPSRLHMLTRKNSTAEIVYRLDPCDQRKEGKAVAG